MKPVITFACHFSKLGWMGDRHNSEIFWFPNKQIEAIKIESNIPISFAVLNNDEEWNKVGKDKIAGSTGKSNPIYAIRCSINDHEGCKICYRVCLKNIGWTAFCSDNEICGNQLKDKNFVIEGMQIVVFDTASEKLEDVIAEADMHLNRYRQIMNHLFVRNSEKLLMACTKDYQLSKSCEVQEINSGLLLPLVRTADKTRDGIYAGGVCDENGKFVTGFDRQNGKKMNLVCVEGYSVEEKDIEINNETVIYGGIYIKHFGHLFAECLSRLWYIIENPDNNYPIVILTIPGHESFTRDFFELLGIAKDRIHIVNKATRYAKVLVPEQSMHLWAGYRGNLCSIYDSILKNSLKRYQFEYEKVYLTRTAFNKGDSVNEDFFDHFFEKRGYAIIAPERYSIAEQVAILAGAKEVICTEGTLSHLALFCKPGTKFVIFRRDDSSILIPQMIINQARAVDLYYVDVTYNFLPTTHAHGQYLYGPTPQFLDFCRANNLSFSEDEVAFDLRDFCYQYMCQWLKHYNVLKNFDWISALDMFDVINRMNRILGEKEISRGKYVTKVKEKEKKLTEENKKLKQQLENIRNGEK